MVGLMQLTTKLSKYFVELFPIQLIQYFNIAEKISPKPLSFERSWWHMFTLKKWTYLFTLLSETAQASYSNVIPILLTAAFTTNNLNLVFATLAGFITLEIINRIMMFKFAFAQQQVGVSYFYAAYKFFLTVDPIYHTTRSSGKILSKVAHTWFDFVTLIDDTVFTIVPALAAFITSTITLSTLDSSVLIVSIPSFFVIVLLNGGGSFYTSKIFKPMVIKSREQANQTSTENLMQTALIRATFTTETQLQKYINHLKEFFGIRTTSQYLGGTLISLSRITIGISVSLVSMILWQKINRGELDSVFAASVVIAYYLGISAVPRIGRVIGNTTDAYIGLTDMWEYVRKFGTQSYPVLPEDTLNN
jgi:hypothetical protein